MLRNNSLSVSDYPDRLRAGFIPGLLALVFSLSGCMTDNEGEEQITPFESKSSLLVSSGEVTYQAESRTAQSGCVSSSNHSGYTGSGFMDFGGNGSWIEWNNINVSSAGEYSLTFRYANGSSSNRQAAIIVNGTSVGNKSFSSSGGWSTWKTTSINATLRSGNNTVRVMANTSSGGANLDKLTVSGGSSSGGTSSGSGNLRVLTGGKWVSVGCGSGAPRADGSNDKWEITDRKLRNQKGVYLYCGEGWADGRDCQCSTGSSERYHAVTKADFNVADKDRKYGNMLTTTLAARGSMYIFPNNAHEFCLATGTNNIIENKDGGDDGSHHESTHKGKCNEWCFGSGCP